MITLPHYAAVVKPPEDVFHVLTLPEMLGILYGLGFVLCRLGMLQLVGFLSGRLCVCSNPLFWSQLERNFGNSKDLMRVISENKGCFKMSFLSSRILLISDFEYRSGFRSLTFKAEMVTQPLSQNLHSPSKRPPSKFGGLNRIRICSEKIRPLPDTVSSVLYRPIKPLRRGEGGQKLHGCRLTSYPS